MARAKKAKVPPLPKVLDKEDLLNTIRILLAHKIYFTLANPTHSDMALHVIEQDVPACQELLPNLFPKRVNAENGYTAYFKLSGAADKVPIERLKA